MNESRERENYKDVLAYRQGYEAGSKWFYPREESTLAGRQMWHVGYHDAKHDLALAMGLGVDRTHIGTAKWLF